MSNINNKQIQQSEVEKKFWKDPRTGSIFNLFIQGKDTMFIADTLSIKPTTIERLITNKYFIVKLESHIRGLVFTNQVAKVIASTNIFSKLWERVADNIEEIPVEICLKELTKMFPTKKEGMIINPKNMNIFMKVMKGETAPEELGEKLLDLEDDLGFEGLEDDSKAIYPELEDDFDVHNLEENDKKDGKQSRDPSMDQKESSENQQGLTD